MGQTGPTLRYLYHGTTCIRGLQCQETDWLMVRMRFGACHGVLHSFAFQDRSPWKLGLTTGQHAGRLLAGFGKGRRRRPYESRCTVCSAPAKSVG